MIERHNPSLFISRVYKYYLEKRCLFFLSSTFHLLFLAFSLLANKRGLRFRNTYPAGLARELVLLAITRSPQPAAGLCLPGRETPAWMRAYAIRQRPRGHDGAKRGKGKGREINGPRWYSNTSVTWRPASHLPAGSFLGDSGFLSRRPTGRSLPYRGPYNAGTCRN